MAAPVIWKIAAGIAGAGKGPEDGQNKIVTIVMCLVGLFLVLSVISLGMIGAFLNEGTVNSEFEVVNTRIYQDVNKVYQDYMKNLTEAQSKIEQKIVEVNTYYIQKEVISRGEYGKEVITIVNEPHCDVAISKGINQINFSYLLSYINHNSRVKYNETYVINGKDIYKLIVSISVLELQYGGKKYRVDLEEVDGMLEEIEERGLLKENKSAGMYNSILTPKVVSEKLYPHIEDQIKREEYLTSYELYKEFLAFAEDGMEEVDFETADPGYIYIPDAEREEILDPEDDSLGAKVIAWALTKLGYPYSQPLRDSGTHFDCSSLTYYAFRSAGVNLAFRGANTAAAQAQYFYESGKTVSLGNLRQGDLVFYSFKENGRFLNVTHVAIYAGNGMVIDASSSKGYVVYRKIYAQGSVVLCGRY